MRIFEAIGFGVLLAALVVVLLFARRAALGGGGGTIEVSVRIADRVPGRGWAPGFGRFAGDEFRWYRMFSFAFRPRHVLSRLDLAIVSRRPAEGPELLALPPGSRVLCCASTTSQVEIAMTEGALTGFLSWLEAAPREVASLRFTTSLDDRAAS